VDTDHLAPLTAARTLRNEGETVALLHAAAAGPHPRRSLLAIRPDQRIVSPAGSGAGLPAVPPRLVHGAAGRGLWVGAVSYDAGLDLLGIPSRHTATVPTLVASWHATYAAFDHDAGTWQITGPDADTHALLAGATAATRRGGRPRAGVAARRARSSHTRARHEAACRAARRMIAHGELFEVNIAHVIEVPWREDGFWLYERLVERSGGDHSAFLEFDDWQIASISPESFLRIDGTRCETRPVKGTRPRGVDASQDAALERALRGSAKDQAENVMIVDLVRNDLTATAVDGSVRVEALCEVERTASVMHLVSVITSRVRPDVRLVDVLVSCFPGGSVTGAPKRRAMEIIDRLEHAPRGFYCGSVFAWEPASKHLASSIAIRTATIHRGVARYGAGGAVTLASDPAQEAAETIVKAQPFLDAANATIDRW
jgi:para-aminobenzoate synthetase component I